MGSNLLARVKLNTRSVDRAKRINVEELLKESSSFCLFYGGKNLALNPLQKSKQSIFVSWNILKDRKNLCVSGNNTKYCTWYNKFETTFRIYLLYNRSNNADDILVKFVQEKYWKNQSLEFMRSVTMHNFPWGNLEDHNRRKHNCFLFSGKNSR